MPIKRTPETETDRDLNLDPLTGEPGAHPVGTGLGAAAAGATGAAIGAVGGPVGSVVGAAIGAIAGGLAGSAVAEMIDPTAEDAYWREHHDKADYADDQRSYDDYLGAYRAGYTGYRRGETFDQREADLRLQYEEGPQNREAHVVRVGHVPPETSRTESPDSSSDGLAWEDARLAARAAYERVQRRDQTPGAGKISDPND